MRRCEWVVPGKRLLRILLQCLPCGCLDKSCLERSQHICAVSEDHNINSRTHKQSQGSQAQIQIHILKCKHRCILFGALGQGHGTWLMWPTMPLGDGDANGDGRWVVGSLHALYMAIRYIIRISRRGCQQNNISSLIPRLHFLQPFLGGFVCVIYLNWFQFDMLPPE